jgi:hypothetical protein
MTYRSFSGPVQIVVDLEELEDLHQVVENGPHWDTIAGINIRRFNPCIPGLTIEDAEIL